MAATVHQHHARLGAVVQQFGSAAYWIEVVIDTPKSKDGALQLMQAIG
jgi:hypothetical protein